MVSLRPSKVALRRDPRSAGRTCSCEPGGSDDVRWCRDAGVWRPPQAPSPGAGLTQAALAEKAGLSTRGIQHLEAGETRPYRQTLERLARALCLAPEQQAGLDPFATPRPRLPSFGTLMGGSDRALACRAADPSLSLAL